MKYLSQKVALTNFKVVEVGTRVAASAFHAVSDPVYYYVSAKHCFQTTVTSIAKSFNSSRINEQYIAIK